jgi:hypothetical protein
MGETPLPFAASFNASLSIEARPERLTGDAGAVLVREVIERTGTLAWVTARLHDPRQPHLITYPVAELGHGDDPRQIFTQGSHRSPSYSR